MLVIQVQHFCYESAPLLLSLAKGRASRSEFVGLGCGMHVGRLRVPVLGATNEHPVLSSMRRVARISTMVHEWDNCSLGLVNRYRDVLVPSIEHTS